jgi:hypothetical protein
MGMLGRPGQMQPDWIELGLGLPVDRVFVIGSELFCQLRAPPCVTRRGGTVVRHALRHATNRIWLGRRSQSVPHLSKGTKFSRPGSRGLRASA